jgi:predicted TIM-barrel fold metal-dependent hydrolase
MIIDVHAHHIPAEFAQFMAGSAPPAGSRPASPPGAPQLPPFEARFEAMSAAGVGRQILSSFMSFYVPDRERGVAGARLLNDHFSALCEQYPDKLSFWATLPLPHVEDAVAEIGRSFDKLGAVGVILSTFVMNGSIAREEFEPMYAELDRRKAVVFLHPCQNGLCSPLINDFGLTVCAGASMEDAVAAMHLIARRIPMRYPNIRFIIPHFGGILPMLLNRLDGQMPQDGFAERPSVTARRFFYDTVGWGSKAALIAAVEAFGDTQLVPGSDYPVLLPWESYTQTFQHICDAGLPDASVKRILHTNAQQLLGIS